MPKRYAPPTRMSMSQWIVVKPCGPHQRATCSGCVQALNTNRRGVSMTRVTTSSRSAVLMFASTSLLLALQFLQVVLQPVEALFPEAAVIFQPVSRALERARSQPAWPPLRRAAAGDQAGVLQHLEVLGDAGKAHVERLREFGDRGLAAGQPRQDRPTCRVRKRSEGTAEAIRGHQFMNQMVK